MVRAGNDHDRQFLWPRPVEHFRERHGLVALAVDDDRVAGNGLRRKAADRDTHQHHAQGARAPRDERHAARYTWGTLDDGLDPARYAVDEDTLARRAHMRRRSTTRPALRCSSMISSISARST